MGYTSSATSNVTMQTGGTVANWGKAYFFNTTQTNVMGFLNDPPPGQFAALSGRPRLPQPATYLAVPRGPDNGTHGLFWNTTTARFEDQLQSWWADYTILVPSVDEATPADPVTVEDDLVVYVCRNRVVLFDTQGFALGSFSPTNSGSTASSGDRS